MPKRMEKIAKGTGGTSLLQTSSSWDKRRGIEIGTINTRYAQMGDDEDDEGRTVRGCSTSEPVRSPELSRSSRTCQQHKPV